MSAAAQSADLDEQLQSLLDRCAAADASALERLYELASPFLFACLTRILRRRALAEEALQDAFLRAFRALEDYQDRERFSAWLTRILVNQCRTTLARTRRREAVFLDVEPRDIDLAVDGSHDGGAWSADGGEDRSPGQATGHAGRVSFASCDHCNRVLQ